MNRRNEAEGGKPWCIERVRTALRNEAYRGDLLTNKVVVLDYLTKKPVRNRGQVEQFYIEEHHAPIIEPQIFDTVQEYMKQGLLNGRHRQIRAAWFRNNPEILERRKSLMENYGVELDGKETVE